jgi:hypothetical protein
MATENNWLQNNLSERLLDNTINFALQLDTKPYKIMSFDDAANYTADLIASKSSKIFIGFSGGMDSEFVFRRMVARGHNVIPVIVNTPINKYESAYAFRICQQYGIKPVIIDKTPKELIMIFVEDIFKKLSGWGHDSVPGLLVGRYAEDHGGIMLMGEHIIDDNAGKMYVGANEWDFYNDVLVHPDNTHYFFTYTPELCCAMVKEMENESVQDFKSRIYNIPWRPKFSYDYGSGYDLAFTRIRQHRLHTPFYNYSFGTKEQFLSLFE